MLEKNEIKFGTDGFRGIIGDNYTFKNLKLLSQAVADYLGFGKTVAVGYDTRFLSGRFARIVSEVLAANQIKVILSDRPIPTPTLSFTVKTRRLDLGIMITASHNPAEYNGFKIKVSTGAAAAKEVTKEIEKRLGKNPLKKKQIKIAKISQEDLISDYIRFIRSYINLKKIKSKRFKVLVDAMYGSGDGVMERILKGTQIKLEFIHSSIDPLFGGRKPEPVEENLEELKNKVKIKKFDLGIALDGDADRIACVAPGGKFIHPQKILGLLALHLNQDRKWSGGIVKTIVGTTMIEKIAQFLKVKLYETPVGFKYISDLMLKEDIVAGGEEAGGMGVKGYIPERDGIVAGLLLLETMAYRNKNILEILNAMERQFGRFYYLRWDLQLDRKITLKKEELPGRLWGKKVIRVKDYDGIKLICEDESWLMFRGSGTEPIIRIYAESRSLRRSKRLIELGKRWLSKHALYPN